MKKKLQVFISSTYLDLMEERQAAVEAVLSAGHIPAGMELFKSGNETQLDVIKRWIDESDVYLLILGGRYGSIEESSGKSYTHLEYEYALEKQIPIFSVVITENALDKKIEILKKDAIETKNSQKYDAFKNLVTGKMCRFFDDLKDIKLAIHETLNDFIGRYKFNGWISGKDVPDIEGMNNLIIQLQSENNALSKENAKLKKEALENYTFDGLSYTELRDLLLSEEITIPCKTFNLKEDVSFSLLDAFVSFESSLTLGVDNHISSDKKKHFLYFKIASRLMKYGLMERAKVAGNKYDKLVTSKNGHKFLALRYKEEREQEIKKNTDKK